MSLGASGTSEHAAAGPSLLRPAPLGRLFVPVLVYIVARIFMPFEDRTLAFLGSVAVVVVFELIWWILRRALRNRRDKAAYREILDLEAEKKAAFEKQLAQAKRDGKLAHFGKSTDA